TSLTLAREVNALCEHFEAALQRGEKVGVDNFLPPAGPVREAALIELVKIDIWYRRKAGEAVAFHDYFARYPELRGTPTLPFDGELPPGLSYLPGYQLFGELGRGGM